AGEGVSAFRFPLFPQHSKFWTCTGAMVSSNLAFEGSEVMIRSMHPPVTRLRFARFTFRRLPSWLALACGCLGLGLIAPSAGRAAESHRFLYVATPGIRDYLEYGGHGILVFDLDHGHRFVKRMASAGLNDKGQPMNVKGICANAKTGRLYVSTIKTLLCF